jgi:hypothetical protein
MRAMGSTPKAFALSLDVTTTADAPSFTPGALPAVTVPLSFLKAGFSFASASSEVSSRTVSSVSKTTGAPFFCGTSTGTISSLKLPALIAAAALRCEFNAYSSCSSRLTSNFSETISPVQPMW